MPDPEKGRVFVWKRRAAVRLVAVVLAACSPGTDRTDGEPSFDRRTVLLNPSDPFWDTQSPDAYRVRFETSVGEFVIRVRREWAPIGADRFYNLVRAGFYDDTRISRVVDGFIAQFGLSGDPAVSAAWAGVTILDDPVLETNTRGSIAYAMTGPDTRWTQVYINLVDNVRLDDQGFAPFGRVEGMDVVDRIYGGYGEDAGGGMRRGDQSAILAEGNVYLDREYPELTRIISAVVE